jgi:hypothetical protein
MHGKTEPTPPYWIHVEKGLFESGLEMWDPDRCSRKVGVVAVRIATREFEGRPTHRWPTIPIYFCEGMTSMRNPERFLEVLDACDLWIPDDSPYLLAKSGEVDSCRWMSPWATRCCRALLSGHMVIIWQPARCRMRYKYVPQILKLIHPRRLICDCQFVACNLISSPTTSKTIKELDLFDTSYRQLITTMCSGPPQPVVLEAVMRHVITPHAVERFMSLLHKHGLENGSIEILLERVLC